MATYSVESLDAMIGETKRELAVRAGVYPRMIAGHKLKPEVAERQTGLMRAILGVLETLRDEAARNTTKGNPP